jgi:lipid II:glycine glycyltransferase (peptidoglycan interpeptide bridge formation enzyme)
MQTAFIEDREGWNSFVSGSRYGHILQSWEWGELKRRQGWEPVRLALADSGAVSAVAQVLVRSLPYGLGRLAYVPRGPAVDFEDTALVADLLEAMRALAADRDVISLKIEPDALDGPVASQFSALGLEPASPVQMRSSIWVDLTASEEEIMARQKQKTRYNVRLAAKKGIVVSHGGPEDVADWYRMYEVTAQRDGFVIHSLDYYRSVLEILGSAGLATLLLAHHEGDLLAGIVVFVFGAKAQYMYGASSNLKRNLMAPYLLQWEGMRWARDRGAGIYDLWGIPDRLEENEELWGVYRHKRGYGGEIVRYVGAFDIVQTPIRHFALERIARPLFKRVARMTA